MGKLNGKIAIVTGAGQGIGKAIALCFAREGADVVVNDLNASTLEATAAGIVALGRKTLAVKGDVSKKEEVDRLVTSAVKAFKRIDILVNNAGITRHAPFLEMSEQDWNVVLDLDLTGVFLCSQAAARHMVKQKSGKIINLASVAGLGATEDIMANYSTAKTGVVGLTKVTARALGPYGINVNAIAPGTILTDIGRTRRTPEEFEAFLKQRKTITVLGKVGTVDDIANLALFLASEDSSFITGQTIACDGGRIDKL